MKILASDYDGTIKVDNEVSIENIEAIRRWRNEGNVFGIITGRSFKTIKVEIATHQLEFDFLICNNGGVIFDEKFTLLELSLMDFEGAMKIIEYIRQYACDGFSVNDGFHRATESTLGADAGFHPSSDTQTVDDIIHRKKIAQIVVAFEEQEEANALAAKLNETFGQYIEAFANVRCVDIVPKGVSKAEGMKFIAQRNGYDLANIYTIGDSYNDICMLEAFQGGTLLHAVDEIKTKTSYITKDVADFINIISKV